jgi:hypothetical protein
MRELSTNNSTLLPPLIVTVWPVASNTVSVEMVLVLVSVIVPSKASVTVPPPDNAALRADSLAFVTTPLPNEIDGDSKIAAIAI